MQSHPITTLSRGFQSLLDQHPGCTIMAGMVTGILLGRTLALLTLAGAL